MAQCKGKRGERWSTVGYTIHLEINFSSKVYSKSLLNRLYDITVIMFAF